ncbi:MAG: patatin-like phospholipase family protein [Hyphomicrobiales bacterium]|nr:patatin-like phospholipase family protein [Hyphomicrobiales bacterium]
MKDTNSPGVKLINLALQGGGAHGAFTWGVLDRLLEDGRIRIEAISGTSAGAMNAVVLADGLAKGGYDGAREALAKFWRDISDATRYSPIQRAPIDMLFGNWSLDASPGYLFFDLLNKMASPYQINPLNLNPLRDIIEHTVDFERMRTGADLKLFISATNVETGRVKVFKRTELTADMVMASACLPFVFQAVEIDGVPYWDGGFMGNPVLFPFHNHTVTKDYVIVQINPVERKGTPRSAREILNRMNEISFNASLLNELRSIEFAGRLIDEGKLNANEFKRVNLHIIEAHNELDPLGASSKFNAEWDFLTHLRDIGRRAADRWLEKNFDMMGQRSSVDMKSLVRGIRAAFRL